MRSKYIKVKLKEELLHKDASMNITIYRVRELNNRIHQGFIDMVTNGSPGL